MSEEIKLDNPDFKIADSNKLTFQADEILVSSKNLCLGFVDETLNFDKIETLAFNIKGKIYTYKKQ